MIEAIEIKWDLLGAKLAVLSDLDQSEFFLGFAKELESFESKYLAEVQMASVNGLLTDDVKKTLERCLPCLWDEK